MSPGRLIQPYVKVMWAGKNLSAYPNGGGELECFANKFEMRLSKTDRAPSCSFEITASADGFALFQELKTTSLTKPIIVEIGYPGSQVKVKQVFRYTGMNMTNGLETSLKVTAVSTIKGAWTDNKISYTMEKEIPLSEFPKFLQEKGGDAAKDLKFIWVGQAKEIASKIMHKGNVVQRPPHAILTDVMLENGIDVQVGDTSIDGTVVLSYVGNYENELSKDIPEAPEKAGKPAVRNFHILGPGWMTSIERSQEFNVGPTNSARNSSTTSSIANETEEKGVVEPDTPQGAAAEKKVGFGTLGRANPGSSASSITKPDPDVSKKRQALAESLTTKCQFTVPCLPRSIAIAPRDIVVVPSLKGPGGYLEDWELTDVSYTQQITGEVMISCTGTRPFTGGESMIAGTPVEQQIKQIVAGLTTPELWAEYYWMKSSPSSMPLAA